LLFLEQKDGIADDSMDYSSGSKCSITPELRRRLFETSNVREYFQKFHSETSSDEINKTHQQQCLPVRRLLEEALSVCLSNSDCFPTVSGPSSCVHPLDFHSPNSKLLALSRDESSPPMVPYLYFGSPDWLASSVKLTNLKPRLGVIPVWLASEWRTQLTYIFVISLSLMMFNTLPCYPFDGYHICHVLTLLHLPGDRTGLLKAINLLGGFLVASNILLAFFNLWHS